MAADRDGNLYLTEDARGASILRSVTASGAPRFQTIIGTACWLDARGRLGPAWAMVVGEVVIVACPARGTLLGVARSSGALLWATRYEDLVGGTEDAGCPMGARERAPYHVQVGQDGLVVAWSPVGCTTLFLSHVDVHRGLPGWRHAIPDTYPGDDLFLGVYLTGLGKNRACLVWWEGQTGRSVIAIVSSDAGIDRGPTSLVAAGEVIERITGTEGVLHIQHGRASHSAYEPGVGRVGTWSGPWDLWSRHGFAERPFVVGDHNPAEVTTLESDGGLTSRRYDLPEWSGPGFLNAWSVLPDGGLLPLYVASDGGTRLAFHQPGDEPLVCALPGSILGQCPLVLPGMVVTRERSTPDPWQALSAYDLPGLSTRTTGRTQLGCGGNASRTGAPLE